MALSASGCGASATDSLPRHAASGLITLDKQPLPSGSIAFDPVDLGKANAVSVGATIRDGTYSISKAEGLTPGVYRVSINSTGASESVSLTEAPGAPKKIRPKDRVPDRYNSKSTLKAEVKEDASNQFNFELSSEKK